MSIISNLITTYNSEAHVSPSVTLDIAKWVTSMVNTFGLNGTAGPDDDTIGWSGIDIPEDAKPVLLTLSQKRDMLRQKVYSLELACESIDCSENRVELSSPSLSCICRS